MIQIGAPLAHDFSNPLGVLSDCHRRIEHFLRLLITVTEQARGGALSVEQREALTSALRYFDEAAPKHTADEEESLFPRLRAARHARAAEARQLVDALAQDHHVARAYHSRIAALAGRWLADGCLPVAAVQELAECLDRLAGLYRSHIAVEDEQLIPLARIILGAAETAAFGGEMAARRGVVRMRRAGGS